MPDRTASAICKPAAAPSGLVLSGIISIALLTKGCGPPF
jgi:hypothetical protein